ncbi:CLUMA_CG013261, isoform A [Clunio marinus]|uniref:CLUMA_CG013261, isoform A n=1 Tax=Clunio marinus TaxID=568069 RepID=A0A1J1ILL5_9DIPT|nr:CLUMA_CG013261, isoform A [Clunio marinus]
MKKGQIEEIDGKIRMHIYALNKKLSIYKQREFSCKISSMASSTLSLYEVCKPSWLQRFSFEKGSQNIGN